MIGVGDEGSGVGEDCGHRSMGGMVGLGVLGGEGGLGGGLEGERGPHPPLVGDGVEGAQLFIKSAQIPYFIPAFQMLSPATI